MDRSNIKQLIAGVATNLGTISSGMSLGFSAVTLPAMLKPYNRPLVSHEQASWIVSLLSIGMPLGCLFIGILLDKIGRKKTLMVVNIPAVMGWFLIASAPHYEPWFLFQMYTGRLLTGIASGIASIPPGVYASEVMDKNLRGLVVTWPSVGISLGVMLVYISGSIFQDDWRLVAGICSLVPIISILAVWCIVPESPIWLLSKGNVQEAECLMRRIRNLSPEQDLPEEELNIIISNSTHQDHHSSWKDIISFLKRPEAYKPLIIFNAFCFFQQFSGTYVVIFYALPIISHFKVKFDDYLATVLIGIIRLVASIIISIACRKFGRRLLCNISGIGLTLSTGSLAIFLTLTNTGVIDTETMKQYSWFPVMAFILSVVSGSAGFSTLPFAMLGEVYPLKIRGLACGFTYFMTSCFLFIALKALPNMIIFIGLQNVFMFFTVAAFVGTIVMYFCLPETQGKTLEEIEDYFRTGKISQDCFKSRNEATGYKLLPEYESE